ncbi:S-layer homology domain-containing protein [Bacillus mycoides]|uniref:S-layer homology domain-containing protein n=1 Tax=Bacillus mycoides TaxID=1405 RepID=UPI002E1BC6C3|nr:S-layer homology domain-containing protein [Bacillus mycoides]MED0929907.1 S-layer homology domain-containing protein [Bacillus mycoides]MED0946319.1 S-layer homology domain-containing protein [Bacillus mycoides]
MKVIKKLFLSFMTCILLFSTLGTTFAEQNSQGNSLSFIDVPKTHWAYKEMMYMAENKIITGYGNGYFGAADPITREHLAAFLYRYLKPQDNANNPFVDIGDSNFNKEILALTARGIFSINAEKKFNPKNNMTRAEMATVLVKAFNLKPQGNFEFTDMKGHWANEYVKILAGNNITSGTGDGNFNPNGIVTREQFSMFLYRTIMKVTDMKNNESVVTYKEYVIQRPTLLYSEPSYLKQANDDINPRTVTVTEEKGNGWKKIKTQNGEKWVAPEGQKYNLQANVKMYLKPSIEEKSTGVLGAQMVTLLDEKPDGWKKVLTDNGTRWIAPEGINYKVENSQTLYSSPDYKSKTVGSIAPQTVRVVDVQDNGWLKIKTYMGDTWIAPKGVAYDLKQNVALYKGPSFLTEKEMYGLMPQTVNLLEDRSDGWKRIKTAYGDRWIVPDGVPYQIAKPTQLYKDYNFYGLEGTIASEKVAIIGEQPGGWYQIKSSKGKHWIAPNGIKYRMKEDLEYKAVNDLMSPSIGTIPKGTIVTMVEDDKILWNGQYVYGFLTFFKRELVEGTDWEKYTRQPNVYASLLQIKNVVTNGHDDTIDKQEWDDLKKWLSEPPMQIKFDFTNDIDYAEFDKLMGEAKKHLNSSNEIFDTVFVEINDAIRLANEGMQQMNQALNGTNSANKGMIEAINSANKGMQQMIEGLNGTNSANKGMIEAINSANEGMQQMIEGLNGTNSAMKGMNEAIKSANEGMQQMIQGVNQANSGLQGMNNAVDQANEGMQQMLNATNKIQQGLKKAISGVDVSVNEINSIIDAPTKAPQSDLKTIHLDFDFSNIVPTSSPEEKLRQQQRDEAMYNLLAGMPFTGNFVSLAELISGKSLNGEEDLKASDYALNMLAVLGGGEIKAGAAFFGSISKVTKRQKLTTTKVDLSWLERFGDKYQAVEVTGTAKVLKQTSILDRRVYQMKDIDWNYVSSNPQAKGLSNLELAKKGRSPFYKDDTQIQLHHTTQREPGSMVELPASKHRKYSKQLHGTIEDGESFRNDPVLVAQYERFRDYYWKQRAQDYQK